MPLSLSGSLSLPITGHAAANAQIRFRAQNASGDIIPGVESIFRCDASGAYSFDLEFARYELATRTSTVDFIVHGTVTVSQDTVASDLEDLINLISYEEALTDELIKLFEKLKGEAEAAANQAEQSATEAAASAQTASDAEAAITPMYNYFNANYPTFNTNYQDFASKYPTFIANYNEVVTKHAQVVQDAAQVAQDKAVTVAKAEEATNAATAATDAEAAITPMYDYFNTNYHTFATDYADFAAKYPDVVSKHADVVTKASETEANAQSALDSKNLAEKWASNPKDTPVEPGKFSAYHWAEIAMYNANLTFISGGTFDPTVSDEYPDVSGVVRDTIWIITLPEGQTTYTFTGGALAGKVAGNGYQLFYDTPTNDWNLIVITATGIISVNGKTGASITLGASDVGAVPVDGGNFTGAIGATEFLADLVKAADGKKLIEKLADKTLFGNIALETVIKTSTGVLKVAGSDSVEHSVYSENNKPTPVDIGALPDTYAPSWGDITGTAPFDDKWITTETTGGLINNPSSIMLADTSAAVAISVGANVTRFRVKDVTGNAETANITLTPSTGKTINGNADETIDKNYGWAEYVLIGTDYKIIGGA